MTIATNNGVPIIQGGKIVTDCSCCGGWYCYDERCSLCGPGDVSSIVVSMSATDFLTHRKFSSESGDVYLSHLLLLSRFNGTVTLSKQSDTVWYGQVAPIMYPVWNLGCLECRPQDNYDMRIAFRSSPASWILRLCIRASFAHMQIPNIYTGTTPYLRYGDKIWEGGLNPGEFGNPIDGSGAIYSDSNTVIYPAYYECPITIDIDCTPNGWQANTPLELSTLDPDTLLPDFLKFGSTALSSVDYEEGSPIITVNSITIEQ
jgi:hypothetical protein